MTIIKDNVFCDYCLKSNSFEGFNQNEFNKLYDNLKENENILKEKIIIENISFAGCGMKAHGYIGVLEILESLNLLKNIKRCSGTSSGAIYALMVSLGYDCEYIKEQLFEDYSVYLDRCKLFSIFTLFNNKYGLFAGQKLENNIKLHINKKFDSDFPNFRKSKKNNTDHYEYQPTFMDIYTLYGRELIVVGTNLNEIKSEYFCPKLTPNMPVFTAVRISISLPFVFDCVNYNNISYIDGGMLNDYPMEIFIDTMSEGQNVIFKKEGETTMDKFIGIYRLENEIFEKDGNPSSDTIINTKININSFSDYIKSMLKCYFTLEENLKYKIVNFEDGEDKNVYIDRTINPKTPHLDSLDFNVGVKVKKDAITQYRIWIMKYLEKFL